MAAGGDVPGEEFASDVGGQLDGGVLERLGVVSPRVGPDGEEARVGGVGLDEQRQVAGGSHDIDVSLDESPGAEVGMAAGDFAVGVAGGEVVVVEEPDLEMASLGGVEDDVHVGPPGVAAEVAVRSRLDAEGAGAAVGDAGDLLFEAVMVVSVLPEEGQQMVAAWDAEFRQGVGDAAR